MATNITHGVVTLDPGTTLTTGAAAGGSLLAMILSLIAIAVGAIVADAIAKRVLLKLVRRWAKHTKGTWDDILVRQGVFTRLAHLAPALVLHLGLPFAIGLKPEVVAFLQVAIRLYILVVGATAVSATLAATALIWQKRSGYEHVPVRGFVQVLQILVFSATTITCLSLLLDRSPTVFLSGLGALTAVLMLIFKDAILGLVAGIQIAANRMLHIGDWLEMPKYGADGDVIDISLTTVKVQNWDKTITTVPTYALISDSFKNWRGMSESGGRRIKRAVYIDMTSIGFLAEDAIQKFRKIERLKPYIEQKLGEVADHNKTLAVDESSPINGRRLTNIGTFRAYLVAYLKQHPLINKEMTFLIRQLAPTERGLPIEIYVFSSDQVWANYEAIQGDIFDHVLAAIPEFGLRVFQNPTGADFSKLG
ncbi:MAG: mechanosensitive ion channel [Verrucomicrobia bacterium]|jgi:miniconductance mechanosensitive channel|nr:mechanosensitive ion channel [Verrucomicrobiota bacterium]MBT7068474.1 mechanosensitive ion channel [Verrucomicrobiota bacterium]